MRWPFRPLSARRVAGAGDAPPAPPRAWSTLPPLVPLAGPMPLVGGAEELAADRRRAVSPVRIGVRTEHLVDVGRTVGSITGVITPIAILPGATPPTPLHGERMRELVGLQVAGITPRRPPLGAGRAADDAGLTRARTDDPWVGLTRLAAPAPPASPPTQPPAGQPPPQVAAPEAEAITNHEAPSRPGMVAAPTPPGRPNLGQARRLGLQVPLRPSPTPPPVAVDRTAATGSPPPAPAASAPSHVTRQRAGDPPAPDSSTSPSTSVPAPDTALLSRPLPPPAPAIAVPPQEVPPSLRRAVGSLLGTDVGAVPVHRDAAADTLTRRLSARAVTHRGVVHLPAAHGPLDRGPARALLAHELTHAVQQRRLGTDVPREDTPAGRRLEAQARSVEQAVGGQEGGGTADAARLDALVARSQAVSDDLAAAGLATRDAGGALVFNLAPSQPVGAPPPVAGAAPAPAPVNVPAATSLLVQRDVPAEAADPLLMPAIIQRAPEESPSVLGTGARPAAAPEPVWFPVAPAPPPPAGGDITAARPPETAPTATHAAPVATAEPAPAPLADAGDPVAALDLDDLARRLYTPISRRLRAELLVDRERAGRATDLAR